MTTGRSRGGEFRILIASSTPAEAMAISVAVIVAKTSMD